ncbi:uncharacterized protein N7529_004607 [Penicillium soppii]|uniref:uncharacterized protein n=1 Tax=Penicillium soppii TaxID=69789 RepID=UPI002546EE97|nr:uncharacterized protein N7529_004607 [Penicillium soppii]KAJ5872254.1 hypothetical protein N7529_004607 [Penicillium soppii]
MATTTTTTTTQTLSVLADYEVHHSGADHESEHEPVTSPQPVEWPTHHRRMPEFRPTNRNLSFEERPGGSNPAEMVFIQVMLHGVWLNAAVSRLWRFTGGRINDKIFHYEVGGEW